MKKLTLREIQEAELKIMTEFDKAARKYNLKYTLCAGSLIGAVRHKGFIPWDDDMDIMMPRPDYEKLIRLNRKKKLWDERFVLASFEDGTLDSPYAKLFDSRISIKEQNYKQKDVKNLWIDIFPMDGLPENERKIKKHYRYALNLCKLNVASVVNNGYGSSKAVTIVKDIFLKPLAKLIGRRRISALQRKLALKYSYSHAPKCGMVTWAYDGPGQAMYREEFEKLIDMPFEGKNFLVTSLWDENLTGIFGDYMTLPPEEDRITHDIEAYIADDQQ